MKQTLRVSTLYLASYLVIWVGVLALLVSPASAQVNGSGPSPANAFDSVFDLSSSSIFSNGFQSAGGVIGQTIQLNIDSGGDLGDLFRAESGSEINVTGGDVGDTLSANAGSEINISGGTVGNSFRGNSGSVVSISGGALGFGFNAFAGSQVELIGGEFKLNGADFLSNTITLAPGDTFTGTLTDGSPFIFR